MNTKTELNRRNFLRGVGVTLALPWMESLQAAAPKAKDSASPKRFLALYVGHGFAITLAEDRKVPLNNLYVTMLNTLDVPIQKFSDSTGSLDDVLKS